MNLRLLLFCVSVGGAFCSFAQEASKSKLVKTEANGVQVYEAQGNESPISTTNSSKPVIEKSISDWSLEECDNSLYYIQLKIDRLREDANTEEEIKKLQDLAAQINSHKSYLISKN